MSNQLGIRNLAILGYHKIGEPPSGGWQPWFYVPEEIFVGHLSYLSEHGSHRSFSKLSLAEQEQELARSKITLEDGLENPVEVFSYPYGDSGTEPPLTSRVLECAGYRAAFLYKGGPNPLPIDEPYHLIRLALGPDTNIQIALEKSRTTYWGVHNGFQRTRKTVFSAEILVAFDASLG